MVGYRIDTLTPYRPRRAAILDSRLENHVPKIDLLTCPHGRRRKSHSEDDKHRHLISFLYDAWVEWSRLVGTIEDSSIADLARIGEKVVSAFEGLTG